MCASSPRRLEGTRLVDGAAGLGRHHHSAVWLYGQSVRFVTITKVCRDASVAVELRVERSVGQEPSHAHIATGRSRHDDPAVGLRRERAQAVAADAVRKSEAGPAVLPEGRVAGAVGLEACDEDVRQCNPSANVGSRLAGPVFAAGSP
jgi:hypothetical protein